MGALVERLLIRVRGRGGSKRPKFFIRETNKTITNGKYLYPAWEISFQPEKAATGFGNNVMVWNGLPPNFSRRSAMDVILFKTYKPSENEEYMCDDHLQYFKEKLLLWRKELLQKSVLFLEDLKANNDARSADTLDLSAQQTEIFIDFSSRERMGQLLQEIELALDRIKAGEYGYCDITDEEIGLKRLEAHPAATRCVESQERFERLVNSRRRSASV